MNQTQYDWEGLGKLLDRAQTGVDASGRGLMLDECVYGTIDRISPQAPMVNPELDSERASLGGAANVANDLAQLGCKVFLAVIGRDHLARSADLPMTSPSREELADRVSVVH